MNPLHSAHAAAVRKVRVHLNIGQLKLLRLALRMSQRDMSEACARASLPLSLASIKRAESGRPVLPRTAQELATFFQVPVLSLMQPAGQAAAACSHDSGHAYERMQCSAVLDAALASGNGRLIELHGSAESGKSALLASCMADAGQRGYRCIALRAQGPGDDTPPLRVLAGALLAISTDVCGEQLEQRIAQRLAALGLPTMYGPACLAMLTGARGFAVGNAHAAQASALDALIRRAARDTPLMMGVDDMHLGDMVLASVLAQVIPASLASHACWMLTYERGCVPVQPRVNRVLAPAARTVIHLAAVPSAMTLADVARAWARLPHAASTGQGARVR